MPYRDLPEDIQQDPAFARTAVQLYVFPFQVLAAVPALAEDRQVWKEIIDSPAFDYKIGFVIRKYVPRHIRPDRDLMWQASLKVPLCFHAVDASVAKDAAFCAVFLEERPEEYMTVFAALVCLINRTRDNTARQLLLDNIKQTFRLSALAADASKRAQTIRLSYHLNQAHHLWTHRSTTVAWFKAGLPFLIRHHPKSFRPGDISSYSRTLSQTITLW